VPGFCPARQAISPLFADRVYNKNMNILDALVEQRIAVAHNRGEFDNLPGAGLPQQLDDDLLIPEEVRLANRVMKNAGVAPPALEQWRERNLMRRQARDVADTREQRRLRQRILALDMALESLRGSAAIIPNEYRGQVAERLAGVDCQSGSDKDSGASGQISRMMS
jgi:hypothetical protein